MVASALRAAKYQAALHTAASTTIAVNGANRSQRRRDLGFKSVIRGSAATVRRPLRRRSQPVRRAEPPAGVNVTLVSPDGPAFRSCERRPLGVRLRLADMAAGLRASGARSRPPDRSPPRALRLFLRPPRHA